MFFLTVRSLRNLRCKKSVTLQELHQVELEPILLMIYMDLLFFINYVLTIAQVNILDDWMR